VEAWRGAETGKEREGRGGGVNIREGFAPPCSCFVCLDGWFCCLFLDTPYLVSWVYGLIWV